MEIAYTHGVGGHRGDQDDDHREAKVAIGRDVGSEQPEVERCGTEEDPRRDPRTGHLGVR